jgi:hypothetical protein
LIVIYIDREKKKKKKLSCFTIFGENNLTIYFAKPAFSPEP